MFINKKRILSVIIFYTFIKYFKIRIMKKLIYTLSFVVWLV